MVYNKPRKQFGIHSAAFRNRSDATFYGITELVNDFDTNTGQREAIALFSGSDPYPNGIEYGDKTMQFPLLCDSFEAFFHTLAGHNVTVNAAEATGNISTLTNKSGTSVVDATTGIATVTLKSGEEARLKAGKYTVVAASATTVNVFIDSSVDFGVTPTISFQDANGKINATALTITASAAVEIPNTGLELTGGSGAIAMTPGDTATFEVRPINEGSYVVDDSTFKPIEFELIVVTQKQKNGNLSIIQFPLCSFSDVPEKDTRVTWGQTTLQINVEKDCALGYAFRKEFISRDLVC